MWWDKEIKMYVSHYTAPYINWKDFIYFLFYKIANLCRTNFTSCFNFKCCLNQHKWSKWATIWDCSRLEWNIKPSYTRHGQVNGERRSNIQYTMWRWRELWSNLLWASMWWTQDIWRIWRKEVSQTTIKKSG